MLRKRAEILKAKLTKERGKYRSDSEFAAAIGDVKPGTLNKWLNADPPVWPERHLNEIADYFKTDIDGLTSEHPCRPMGRAKESSGNYYDKSQIRQYLDNLPLSEQVEYAVEVLSKAKKAIAV